MYLNCDLTSDWGLHPPRPPSHEEGCTIVCVNIIKNFIYSLTVFSHSACAASYSFKRSIKFLATHPTSGLFA